MKKKFKGKQSILKNTKDNNNKKDFSMRLNLTFTIGMYIAINAISDSYLLIDSPDCANMKIYFIQGNHDLTSNLTSVSGYHRIANTAIHPRDMVASREVAIYKKLKKIAEYKESKVIYISSMPMATIIGIDYERIARKVAEETKKLVLHIPSKSLSGDWLDGYSETLLSLAKSIDLSNPKKNPKKVAIVGYLMDRNEEDHQGNIKELKRILDGIDLELASTWLCGKDLENLSKIKDSSFIISLPYARKASKVLSERLNIPVIETDLPFGIEGTRAWIKKISIETNTEKEANIFIDKELEKIIPRLEWVIQYIFLHKKIAFIGDPCLFKTFSELISELGSSIEKAILLCSKKNANDILNTDEEQKDNILIEPKINQIMKTLKKTFSQEKIHLFVGNSYGINFSQNQAPYFEFGFPSFFNHVFYEKPFFGFNGAIAFIENMVNHILKFETIKKSISCDLKNLEKLELLTKILQ